jgi:hypothetical protein
LLQVSTISAESRSACANTPMHFFFFFLAIFSLFFSTVYILYGDRVVDGIALVGVMTEPKAVEGPVAY